MKLTRPTARALSLALCLFGIGSMASCGAKTSPGEARLGVTTQALVAPFSTIRQDRIGTFRSGSWFLDLNGNGIWEGCAVDRCVNYGGAGDQPLVGNWGGPGGFESVGVYRPSEHTFYLDYNGNGWFDGCSIDRCYSSFVASQAGDRGVAGSWDGSGISSVGVFRNGTWYLDKNRNGIYDGCTQDSCPAFGMAGDVPVVGRWNGGFQSNVGVFRGSSWFLDQNGNGIWDDCASDVCGSFGGPTDQPFTWRSPVAGTQKTALGTLRNDGSWFLDANNDRTWNDCSADDCVPAGLFGGGTDQPIAGDWPTIAWTGYGDKDLASGLNNPFGEDSAVVVPPGKVGACPSGRAFTGTAAVGLLKADLSCLGNAGCATDIYPTKLAPLLTSSAFEIDDPYISSDNQLMVASNGDLFYVRQSRVRQVAAPLTGVRLRDKLYVDQGAYLVWRSQDCGDNWTLMPPVLAEIANGGACTVRQTEDRVAFYRPSENKFYFDKNGDYKWNPGPAVTDDFNASLNGMVSTDTPVIGDWNGSVDATIGYFHNGSWKIDFNGTYQIEDCTQDLCFSFGTTGDIPVVGRWVDPGTSTYKPDLRSQIGVFRNGTWFLDVDSDGVWNAAIDKQIGFGMAGDKPVVGQWGNAGSFSAKTRVGVFRPSTNQWLLDTGPEGWQGCGVDTCISTFGGSPQIPLAGIWSWPADATRHNRERVATFQDGMWYEDRDSSGTYDNTKEQFGPFGAAGDVPLVGRLRGWMGGFDRVEAYADPYSNMLYLTSICAGAQGEGNAALLFSSNNGGQGWRAQQVTDAWAPMLMTSTRAGKLYLFFPSTNPKLWPATVNATTNTVTLGQYWYVFQQHAASKGPTPPSSNGWADIYKTIPELGVVGNFNGYDGSFGISSISGAGSVDSVRIYYAGVEASATTPPVSKQILFAARLDVTSSNGAVTGIANTSLGTIRASGSKGSVTQATPISGPPGMPTDLVYWKETDGSTLPTAGNVRVRGAIFKDATSKTGITLSPNWSPFVCTGDYVKGASYQSGQSVVFVPEWTATPAGFPRSLHSQLVQVAYP
jgi:hypothetical protein